MTIDTKERNALRYWRKQRGLSQKVLAEALGVNKMFISLWENGHSQPTRQMMEGISAILQKPVTLLFDLG